VSKWAEHIGTWGVWPSRRVRPPGAIQAIPNPIFVRGTVASLKCVSGTCPKAWCNGHVLAQAMEPSTGPILSRWIVISLLRQDSSNDSWVHTWLQRENVLRPRWPQN
jgi:hypothetical protein